MGHADPLSFAYTNTKSERSSATVEERLATDQRQMQSTTYSPDSTIAGDPPAATGRILVVEDSPLMRSMLIRLLGRVGHTDVLTADSGESAFAILRCADDTNPSSIDLILMDMVLPDLDGITAITTLQASEQLKKIPVIMVTAMHDPETLRSAFEAGATDFITKPINEVELLARVGAALRLKNEIDRREARERDLLLVSEQLAQANEQLRQLSLTDPLTGLANRRCFDQVLQGEWARAIRDNSSITLLLADIDEFKQYNDTFGHQEGDRCLVQVGEAFRSIAYRSTDLAARYGGEEFAILLPNTDLDGGVIVGQRLVDSVLALQIPHAASANRKMISASVGVASITPSGMNRSDQLIAQADEALYEAKRTGRSRVVIYQPAT